jgi:hypothetical protein
MKTRPFHKALCASLLALVGLLGTSGAIAQICTREYAPLCGQVAGEPAPRTFANRCLMDAAKATLVSQAECAALPVPMVGGDVDVHGCKGSAGFVWNAELQQCVRPWMSKAITLEVASKRQSCTGVIDMQCLMVRERVPGQAPPKWAPFFGSIKGFTYVPGQRYTLRVRKDKLNNPPADVSDTTYTLIKVLP